MLIITQRNILSFNNAMSYIVNWKDGDVSLIYISKSNPIENLHIMMCKQILGVQKQTTNIGVLLELGRIPMHIYAAKHAVKNWERIKRGQANCVLLASYRDAIEVNLPWLLGIKSVLE